MILASTTQPSAVSNELIAGGLLTGVALVLAGLGQRRLPRGAGEALFVAGVSGLLLLNYASLGDAIGTGPSVTIALTGLAMAWLLVAAWIEPEPRTVAEPAARERRQVRRELAIHVAAIALLLAGAEVWRGSGGRGPTIPSLALLLAVAAGLYFWRHTVLSRYALVGLCAATLLQICERVGWRSAHATRGPLWLLALGLLALAIVLATVLADWRRRVHVWRTAPERLTEPAPAHRWAFGIALVVAVGMGTLAWTSSSAWAPVAVALAALAALSVGHCWRSNAVGECGLALAGSAVVLAARTWLPTSAANDLMGLALAGLWMLWLARFWEQQLQAGQAWTTAGRLISAARNLSFAAVGGEVILAAVGALGGSRALSPGDWQTAAAGLLILLHAALLARTARSQSVSTGALATGLAFVAAVVPLRAAGLAFGHYGLPGVWLAGIGVLIAAEAGAARRAGSIGWPYDAYLGGFIPAAIAYDFVWRGPSRENLGLLAGALVLLGAAIVIRWRRVRAASYNGRHKGGPTGPAGRHPSRD